MSESLICSIQPHQIPVYCRASQVVISAQEKNELFHKKNLAKYRKQARHPFAETSWKRVLLSQNLMRASIINRILCKSEVLLENCIKWSVFWHDSFGAHRLFAVRLHAGREPRLYFWQDSNRNEVDLLWEHQRKLIPLEIKSAMTWNREFAANVAKFQHSIPDAAKGYVVHAGDLFPEDEHFRAVHFSQVSRCFQSV